MVDNNETRVICPGCVLLEYIPVIHDPEAASKIDKNCLWDGHLSSESPPLTDV